MDIARLFPGTGCCNVDDKEMETWRILFDRGVRADVAGTRVPETFILAQCSYSLWLFTVHGDDLKCWGRGWYKLAK